MPDAFVETQLKGLPVSAGIACAPVRVLKGRWGQARIICQQKGRLCQTLTGERDEHPQRQRAPCA